MGRDWLCFIITPTFAQEALLKINAVALKWEQTTEAARFRTSSELSSFERHTASREHLPPPDAATLVDTPTQPCGASQDMHDVCLQLWSTLHPQCRPAHAKTAQGR